MKYFDNIFGNSDIKNMFESLAEKGKLSHAYLIEGPAGSGKKSLCLAIAAMLLCGKYRMPEQCRSCDKCKKILDGHSADIISIVRTDDKKTIGVDQIRSFISTVYFTPNELDFKMYIFEEADRITPQAQNALLKVIEEPPTGVYIFLLCENSASLLGTIRSRVQKITLGRLSDELITEYMSSLPEVKKSSDNELIRFAIKMSAGEPEEAKRLIAGGKYEYSVYKSAENIIECLSKKNMGVNYFNFLSLINSSISNRDDLALLTDYLLKALRDIMVSKTADNIATGFYSEGKEKEFAGVFTLVTIKSLIENIMTIKKDGEFNTNLNLSSAMLAVNLWQA